METLVGSVKVLASIGSVICGAHFVRRSALAQRSHMRRVLWRSAMEVRREGWSARLASSSFPRTHEVSKLTTFLKSPNPGIVVLTGPEGSGTSAIAKAALDRCQTNMILNVNLRESVLMAERGFLEQFVRCTGFYSTHLPLVDLGMLKWDGYNQHEVGTSLRLLVDVLRKEKAERGIWNFAESDEPPPVICIDEIHDIVNVDDGEDFEKFLHWVIFVTENQLAHVLLIARPHASLSLDRLPEFRTHRRRLVVDFPSNAEVKISLETLDSFKRGLLTEADIQSIVDTFGGQLKDLRNIRRAVQSAADGEKQMAWKEVQAELLSDSKDMVVRKFESHIDEGNQPDLTVKQRVAAYKRGLRYWKMAELLVEEGVISWQKLVSEVFAPSLGSAAEEIRHYIEAGILTLAPPETGDSPASFLRVTVTKPRLRASFAMMLKNPRCLAYKAIAEAELAKAECRQREAQLRARRKEQALQQRGLAELLHNGCGGQFQGVAKALAEENQATVKELLNVRAEYDNLKWKGRWVTPK